MSWLTFTEDDVTDQFTEAEAAVIQAVQSSGASKLPGIVSKTIAQVRDDIRSGGYALDEDAATIPEGLHNDAIAIARWKLLITLPSNEDIQTKDRKAESDQALAKLKRISEGKYSVEPPTGAPGGSGGTAANTAGNWNSENKFLGRTNPVPRPGPTTAGRYANDGAPTDAS
jgi:hypothetical protein